MSERKTIEPDRGGLTRPPTLRIISGSGETAFPLDGPELSLGRAPENDIRIDVDVVSGLQARLIREGLTYRFIQIGQTNPTMLHGVPVAERVLQNGDRLEISPGTPDAVTLVFELPMDMSAQTLGMTRPFQVGDKAAPGPIERLDLQGREKVTIGRASRNDLALPSLSVSRFHAKLEIEDGAARLSDVGSANGTYVNGARIQSHTLVLGDIIRIGPYRLVYQDGAIEHYDDSRAVRLDAHEVTKVIGGTGILHNLSFSVLPGEVFAIAGTSGAGKSMLLGALNGTRPPTSGHILVNGADFYSAFDALRPLIGYVPQENILPSRLGVQRALHYVARLRLPPDVSSEEAERRVEEAMRQLDLYDRRDVQIEHLSGGQQKRASIAAELIASPGLFYLDEPTSGLDPGLTRRVTAIVRELAAGGSTVIIISHDVESLQAADRVLFLGNGGRLVFIGTVSEALTYFEVDDLAEIYPRVEAEDSAKLERQFQESEHYRAKVAPGLVQAAPQEGEESSAVIWDPVAAISAGARGGASAWRQFWIATARYIESMFGDRLYLALLLGQAPIVALLLILVAKSTDLQPPPAEAIAQAGLVGIPAAKLAATLPIMLAASATWFGAINSAREIVKELPILQRERLAGLRTGPYLGSKFIVLLAICLFQTTVLLGIISLKVDLPSSGVLMWGPLELWISLSLAAAAALGLGLLLSASFQNADRAQSLVPIILIPQLIFVGGPGTGMVGQWLSYLMGTHWSVEAMKVTAGIPYNTDATGFGAVDLLLRWAALVVMMVVLLSLAAWRISRRRSG